MEGQKNLKVKGSERVPPSPYLCSHSDLFPVSLSGFCESVPPLLILSLPFALPLLSLSSSLSLSPPLQDTSQVNLLCMSVFVNHVFVPMRRAANGRRRSPRGSGGTSTSPGFLRNYSNKKINNARRRHLCLVESELHRGRMSHAGNDTSGRGPL